MRGAETTVAESKAGIDAAQEAQRHRNFAPHATLDKAPESPLSPARRGRFGESKASAARGGWFEDQTSSYNLNSQRSAFVFFLLYLTRMGDWANRHGLLKKFD
jgi:hypothetical protein